MFMKLRKIIAFGKSSFIISLPKKWLKNNNLTSGNYVSVIENDTSISIESIEKNKKIKKICNLNVEDLPISAIKKLILSAYVKGAEIIEIKCSNIIKKNSEIKTFISKLNGLNIIESGKDKIIIEDLLDYSKLSINNMIKRCEIIIKYIFSILSEVHSKADLQSINERYEEVNSIQYLINRIINLSCNNNEFNIDINNHDKLNFFLILKKFKLILKNCLRTADTIFHYSLSDYLDKNFIEYIKNINNLFSDLMNSYHSKNFMLANDSFEDLKKLEKDVYDKFGVSKNIYLNKIYVELLLIIIEIKYLSNIIMNEQVNIIEN